MPRERTFKPRQMEYSRFVLYKLCTDVLISRSLVEVITMPITYFQSEMRQFPNYLGVGIIEVDMCCLNLFKTVYRQVKH